jgi:hypothetical protein
LVYLRFFVGADIITDLDPALICFFASSLAVKPAFNYYINVFFPGNSSGLRTELYFLPSIIRFYHQTLLPYKPHKQNHISGMQCFLQTISFTATNSNLVCQYYFECGSSYSPHSINCYFSHFFGFN